MPRSLARSRISSSAGSRELGSGADLVDPCVTSKLAPFSPTRNTSRKHEAPSSSELSASTFGRSSGLPNCGPTTVDPLCPTSYGEPLSCPTIGPMQAMLGVIRRVNDPTWSNRFLLHMGRAGECLVCGPCPWSLALSLSLSVSPSAQEVEQGVRQWSGQNPSAQKLPSPESASSPVLQQETRTHGLTEAVQAHIFKFYQVLKRFSRHDVVSYHGRQGPSLH